MPSPRATGQIVEWLVWVNLVAAGPGTVHLFLPLDDRGVDGILRRPADDTVVALQVKGHHQPDDGSYLDVEITDWSLDDHGLRYILTMLTPNSLALAPTALLVDAQTIRKLATPIVTEGEHRYRIDSPMPPPPGGLWAPYAVNVAELVMHLLPPAAPAEQVAPPAPVHREAEPHWMGALAEAEVMRLLSDMRLLNVFKAFPDLELTEYLVRHVDTGAMRGIQVKCVGLDGPRDGGMFHVSKHDLAVPTSAFMVVLGWRRDIEDFDELALLFPAARMKELASNAAESWVGKFHPRPAKPARFDDFRVARKDVGRLVVEGLKG